MRTLALVTDAFGGHGSIAQYNRDLTTALSSLGNIQSVHSLVGRHPHAAVFYPWVIPFLRKHVKIPPRQ